MTESGRLPLVAVILAGGSGTRLWPMARAARPKQFLSLFNGKSLFQMTWDRVRPLIEPANVLVVCGVAHVPLVRRQAPVIPRRQILAEGTGRNTAASIALAAFAPAAASSRPLSRTSAVTHSIPVIRS